MAFCLGTFDWSKLHNFCSDVRCSCGTYLHHCTHARGSAKFFRCYDCGETYALGDQVRLLTNHVMPDGVSHSNESIAGTEPVYASAQGEGTVVEMNVACLCAKEFTVSRSSCYEERCPHCKQHYFVDWYIPVRKATPEEIAAAEVIHKCGMEEELT